MNINLKELLSGKATKIGNKEFLETKEYVNPFLDIVSKYTENFQIKGVKPKQITINETEEDLTWNRFFVEAILPEKYSIDGHSSSLLLIGALDKNIIKQSYIKTNSFCTNMTIFNPKHINTQKIDEKKLTWYFQDFLEQEDNFTDTIKKLKESALLYNERHDILGKLIDTSMKFSNLNKEDMMSNKLTKLPLNHIIKAYQCVYYDDKSKYFKANLETNQFHLYSAITQNITDDEDFLNKPEQSYTAFKLFENLAV